jgi:hypothetical protein
VESQVDEVHPLDPERAQVVLDALPQLGRALSGQPPALIVAARADLGDEPQSLGVGIQRLADQFVDDVGAIELRGVDVVDAELDGAAQDRAGLVGITGRAEHAGTRELHGAVADSPDRLVAEERCLWVGHGISLR